MVSIEGYKVAQNALFLSLIEGLVEERFFSVDKNKVVKILEVGCGTGDLTLVFKDHFKDKVEITAIDSSDDVDIAISKSEGSGIGFKRVGIFEYKTEEKYDLVIFTKSLHHCIPVNKAIEIANGLLKEGGIVVAEEVTPQKITPQHSIWFLDRLDLLRSAGCLDSAEKTATASKMQKNIAKLLDSSLPAEQRWIVPPQAHGHDHNHSHSHEHEHQHQHGHDQNHTHSQIHEHNHIDEEIANESDVITAINDFFGKANVVTTQAPFFYNFLGLCGLKDNKASIEIMEEFIKQEKRAIQQGILLPFGLNIVAKKK